MRHARAIRREIAVARSLGPAELCGYAKDLCVPLDLLKKTAELGRLPVVNFAAGGLGQSFRTCFFQDMLRFRTRSVSGHVSFRRHSVSGHQHIESRQFVNGTIQMLK